MDTEAKSTLDNQHDGAENAPVLNGWTSVTIWDWCDALKPEGDTFDVHPYSGNTDKSGAMVVTFDQFVNLIITKVHLTPASADIQSASDEQLREFGKPWNAVWDTGSPDTMISNAMAKTMRLKIEAPKFTDAPIPESESETDGDAEPVELELPQSMINLHLPSGTFKNIPVTILPAENFGDVDLFIGMDIIQQGDFVVSHADDKTQMTFRVPSQGPISFLENVSA